MTIRWPCNCHFQQTGRAVRRVFGPHDFVEISGDSGLSPLNPEWATRRPATYHHPQPQDGWASANKFLDKALVVVAVLVPLALAMYNFVDAVSDVLVAVDLWRGGDRWLAVMTGTITFVTLLVSVVMLLFERQYVGDQVCGFGVSLTCRLAECRYAAALCQTVSLGGLYNAVMVLWKPSQDVVVDFAQATPLLGACREFVTSPCRVLSVAVACVLPAGEHAVVQLKGLEAVAEAAPQLAIQLYAALVTGYSRVLAVSLGLSLVSTAVSFSMGDRAAVASHATQQLGKAVSFPLGLQRVKGTVAIDFATGELRRGVRKVKDYLIHISSDFPVVVLFRTAEVVARLGIVALMCAVVGRWAFMAVLGMAASAAFFWFGTLPIVWLGLAWPLPKVWRHVTTDAPLPKQVSFSRVVVALVYCCIAFPGVGQAALHVEESGSAGESKGTTAGGRAPPSGDTEGNNASGGDGTATSKSNPQHSAKHVSVNIEPWMQPLWTEDWSIAPSTFVKLRVLEQAIMLAIMYVLLA